MEKGITSRNRSETVTLGRALGAMLQGGEVLGLVGELGTGKTTFVKGIAKGLGIPDRLQVNSPSFVLLREYGEGRLPLYHFDAHRLAGAGDLLRLEQEIGLDDYLYGEGVSVLEWADRLERLLPEAYLRVEFRYHRGNQRILSFRPFGNRYEKIVRDL